MIRPLRRKRRAAVHSGAQSGGPLLGKPSWLCGAGSGYFALPADWSQLRFLKSTHAPLRRMEPHQAVRTWNAEFRFFILPEDRCSLPGSEVHSVFRSDVQTASGCENLECGISLLPSSGRQMFSCSIRSSVRVSFGCGNLGAVKIEWRERLLTVVPYKSGALLRTPELWHCCCLQLKLTANLIALTKALWSVEAWRTAGIATAALSKQPGTCERAKRILSWVSKWCPFVGIGSMQVEMAAHWFRHLGFTVRTTPCLDIESPIWELGMAAGLFDESPAWLAQNK